MKYIATFVLGLALLFPSLSFAATSQEVETQYRAAITQLIQLLIQQVQTLQAQLAAQQSVVDTTPPDTVPVFGATQPAPFVPLQPINSISKPMQLKTALFEASKVQGKLTFRVMSNKPLAFDKTVYPQGVSQLAVIESGIMADGTVFGLTKDPAYYYAATIDAPTGYSYLDFTVQDTDGQTFTKTLEIQN